VSDEVHPESDQEREDRLDAIIAGYLKAIETGGAPDHEELIAAHREFEEELREYLKGEDLIARLGLKAKPRDAPRAPPPAPAGGPRIFGDFELLEEIARGGMGVVYRARQMSVDRIVALKMVRSAAMASREDLLRFQIEAKAAASLDHPNIVPLYEVGEREGSPYFSMKFIEGGNLADHFRYLKSDPGASACLMETIAGAVHFAHTRGVLHRDLKPGNILIDRDGNPYVSDFGLAKRIEDDGSLTLSGAVLGTPGYMSPEQAAGKTKAMTTASDVYSLGAIFYELLAGRPAFQGQSSLDILEKVIRDEPEPPSRIEPRVPRDLEIICLKCLEKEPRRRYVTAADLAEDLRRYRTGEPISARPSGVLERSAKWVRRRPAAAAALAVSVLALAALLGVSLWYNVELRLRADEIRAQELVARRYVYATRMEMAFDEMEKGNTSRVLDHMRSLVPPPGRENLRGFEWYHLWRACNGDLFTLRGHSNIIIRLAFSPDSRTLATASHDGSVKLWDTSTGKEIAELQGPPSHVDSLAFSPDGATIASSNEDHGVRLWDVAARRIKLTLRGHEGTVTWVAFSPDGKVLATSSGDRTVRLWDPSSGIELGRLGTHDNTVHCVRFSPDGKWIATATQDAIVNLYDRQTGQPRFSLNLHVGGPSLSLAFARDSTILAVGFWEGQVQFLDIPTGKELRWVQAHKGPARAVDFDPRSMNLTSAGADHVVNILDGEHAVLMFTLRGHAGSINAAAWSPDGLRIATGSSDGTAKIWDARSTGEPSPFDHIEPVNTIAVSDDGKTVFSGNVGGEIILAALHPRGTGPALEEKTLIDLRESIASPYRLSPDGRFLCSIGKGKGVEVWTIDWKGRRAIPDHVESQGAPGTAIAFLPDSRGLAAAGEDGSLIIRDLVASPEGDLWRERSRQAIPARDVLILEASPDGRMLALARDKDPAIFIQDLASGKTESLKGHTRPIAGLAFSPDSRLLATGSLDLTARLWRRDPDSAEGKWREWKTFNGHMEAIGALAFSPDGKVLATGSDDKTVRLWDLITGEVRATLRSHRGHVKEIIFTPDGRTMISAGGRTRNGEMRIWRTATDEEVARRL
jgi:WD40 repeat protein/tRNA A-37 threonylcarbamoyl transferase component Bud32